MSSLGSVGYKDSVDWSSIMDHGESSGACKELEEPSESEGYAFRSKTIEVRKASQVTTPVIKKGRRILTPSKTGSMYIQENHDCANFNVDHTVSKVMARFFFSLFRFAMSYAWECETMRGNTKFNGASSNCHGKCHAAHAALSPALYDNYLKQIEEKVKRIGYEKLSNDEKGYLNGRFILKAKDYKLISSKDEKIRSDFMAKLVSGLEIGKRRGSFVQTPLDFARNITFEGPAASNRVDCHLERHLRPLEDELAERCMMLDALPKEALKELFFSYQKLLTKLKEALNLDRDRFSILNKCWEDLVEAQKKSLFLPEEALLRPKEGLKDFFGTLEGGKVFQCYVTAAMEYQKAFKSRFENAHGGVPWQKTLKDALIRSQSTHVLSQIIGAFKFSEIEEAFETFTNQYRNLIRPLTNSTINATVEKEFQNGNEEINKRIVEVDTQLSVINQGFEEVHSVIKMYFGVKDENGKFITPTKEDLKEKLNGWLVPISVDLSKSGNLSQKLNHPSEESGVKEDLSGDSSVESLSFDDLSFDELSLNEFPLDGHSLDELSFDGFSYGGSSLDEFSLDGFSYGGHSLDEFSLSSLSLEDSNEEDSLNSKEV
jgi:hypothetical protein